MGSNDISKDFRSKFDHDIGNLRSSLNRIFHIYYESVSLYNESMGQSLDEAESYFKPKQMTEIHERTKRSIISQV